MDEMLQTWTTFLCTILMTRKLKTIIMPPLSDAGAPSDDEEVDDNNNAALSDAGAGVLPAAGIGALPAA